MKVVIDAARLREELIARGWDGGDLRRHARIGEKTIASIWKGQPVQLTTWARVNRALALNPPNPGGVVVPAVSPGEPATPEPGHRG